MYRLNSFQSLLSFLIDENKHLCLVIMHIMLNYFNESSPSLFCVVLDFPSFESGALSMVIFQSNCDNKTIT